MKHCNKCDTTKSLGEFYPKRDSNSHMATCKECSKAAKRAWAKANRERIREYDAVYREREDRKAYQKDYMRKHQQENKAYWNARNSKYRAAQLNATPSWLTEEDLMRIEWKFNTAKHMAELTGNSYHVDHIVPLRGETVCGLHVPWNLQVLTAEENLRKSNKLS